MTAPASTRSPDLAGPLATRADTVFAGALLALGPPPDFVSGEVQASQVLTLEVRQVWKGELGAGSSVDVEVVVVPGGKNTVAGASGVPMLDPGTFRVGQVFLVYAAKRSGRLVAVPHGDAVSVL